MQYEGQTDHIAKSEASRARKFRVIGLGTCGTVFETPRSGTAIKKGPNAQALWTDFDLTNRVRTSIHDARDVLKIALPNLCVPRTPSCHGFHRDDDETFWSATGPFFPSSHSIHQTAFEVDRISPIPHNGRDILIEEFFDQDERIQLQAKHDIDNTDCLVRLYFGERESDEQQERVYDTLRNFPLRLNMMEALALDTKTFVQEMAIGLAILHWQAGVDAMDVEFVLGGLAQANAEEHEPSREAVTSTQRSALSDILSKKTDLWILDFDKARSVEADEDGVKRHLVPAFLSNDPYFPLPNIDKGLWRMFCEAYLQASEEIMKTKEMDASARHLPKLFLNEVQRRAKENESWSAEDNIVFAE